MSSVASLYRYPIKGMTPERMPRVTLEKGGTMPSDRAWAIENGPGRFDPSAPKWLPKVNFVMLMRDERLATLDAAFDDATQTLTIKRAGKQVARGDLGTPIGRQMIEQFIAAYMKGLLRGAPKLVRADGHSFSDVSAKCLHIVNLASVRDLERVAGRPVDPLRFRANVDGLKPWAEDEWVAGARVALGAAELSVFKPIVRWVASHVNLETGERDIDMVGMLREHFGRDTLGMYFSIAHGGTVRVGDTLTA